MLHPQSPVAEPAGAPVAAAPAPMAPLPTAVTAFIGRTLKGPLDPPTAIASFADYQQHFGGLWQPAPLSYAVEQFFGNGGQQAIIVRVANGARPPSLRLPAASGAPLLGAPAPRTREYPRGPRAYAGLPAAEADPLNLAPARLR